MRPVGHPQRWALAPHPASFGGSLSVFDGSPNVIRRLDRRIYPAVMAAPALEAVFPSRWIRRSSRRMTKRGVPPDDVSVIGDRSSVIGRWRGTRLLPTLRVIRRFNRRIHETCGTSLAPEVVPASRWIRRSSRRMTTKEMSVDDAKGGAAALLSSNRSQTTDYQSPTANNRREHQ